MYIADQKPGYCILLLLRCVNPAALYHWYAATRFAFPGGLYLSGQQARNWIMSSEHYVRQWYQLAEGWGSMMWKLAMCGFERMQDHYGSERECATHYVPQRPTASQLHHNKYGLESLCNDEIDVNINNICRPLLNKHYSITIGWINCTLIINNFFNLFDRYSVFRFTAVVFVASRVFSNPMHLSVLMSQCPLTCGLPGPFHLLQLICQTLSIYARRRHWMTSLVEC